MNLVTVSFKSNMIEVIEETQLIVVKDICDNLGLGFAPQYNKLKTDETYQSKLIKVQTNGGMQEVFTIPLSKLNGWLFSINPNKVKPEVRDRLIEYKNECFDVLNSYFNKGIAVNKNVVNGYKSQIAQHNNKIKLLENRLLTLPNVDYKAKYEKQRETMEKMYEEYWELKSFFNKTKMNMQQVNI